MAILSKEDVEKWVNELEALLEEPDIKAAHKKIKNGGAYLTSFTVLEGDGLGDAERSVLRTYLWNADFKKALLHSQLSAKATQQDHATVLATEIEEIFHKALQDEKHHELAWDLIDFANEAKLDLVAKQMDVEMNLNGDEEMVQSALKIVDDTLAQVKNPQDILETRLARELCKLAFLACASWNHDFGNAVKYLNAVSKMRPGDRDTLLERMSWDASFKEFKKSPEFKSGGPVLPKDKVLVSAYERALDEPYATYTKLEKHKSKTKDPLDLLAVQHYCIALICSDLGEHGEANLEEYGAGEISVKEFHALLKKRTEELKKGMTQKKIKAPPFWTYKGFKSFSGIPF